MSSPVAGSRQNLTAKSLLQPKTKQQQQQQRSSGSNAEPPWKTPPLLTNHLRLSSGSGKSISCKPTLETNRPTTRTNSAGNSLALLNSTGIKGKTATSRVKSNDASSQKQPLRRLHGADFASRGKLLSESIPFWALKIPIHDKREY